MAPRKTRASGSRDGRSSELVVGTISPSTPRGNKKNRRRNRKDQVVPQALRISPKKRSSGERTGGPQKKRKPSGGNSDRFVRDDNDLEPSSEEEDQRSSEEDDGDEDDDMEQSPVGMERDQTVQEQDASVSINSNEDKEEVEGDEQIEAVKPGGGIPQDVTTCGDDRDSGTSASRLSFHTTTVSVESSDVGEEGSGESKRKLSDEEKTTLRGIVKRHVFPRAKIITHPNELRVESGVAKIVMRQMCRSGYTMARKIRWWNDERKQIVRRELCRKRNNVNAVMKTKFLSKYSVEGY